MQGVPLKKKEDGRLFRLRLAETADWIPAQLAIAAQPTATDQSQCLATDGLASQDTRQQKIEDYDAVEHAASRFTL